jgi:hypothetical protein
MIYVVFLFMLTCFAVKIYVDLTSLLLIKHTQCTCINPLHAESTKSISIEPGTTVHTMYGTIVFFNKILAKYVHISEFYRYCSQ